MEIYTKIIWKNDFDNWELIRIPAIRDGHCFFHAIVNGFYTKYHTLDYNNKLKFIKKFRKELSEELTPTHYEMINNGMTAEFAKDGCNEFSISNMQKQLDSNNSIGYGYIEFIGNIIDRNIYILDDKYHDIYGLYKNNESLCLPKSNRSAIVLYYINDNHYELVGVKEKDGSISTHFGSKHSFIRFLYERIKNKK